MPPYNAVLYHRTQRAVNKLSFREKETNKIAIHIYFTFSAGMWPWPVVGRLSRVIAVLLFYRRRRPTCWWTWTLMTHRTGARHSSITHGRYSRACFCTCCSSPWSYCIACLAPSRFKNWNRNTSSKWVSLTTCPMVKAGPRPFPRPRAIDEFTNT